MSCLLTRRTLLGALAAGASAQIKPELWDPSQPVPKQSELAPLASVRFSVIKPYEPERDGGYGFLHGVALQWHRHRLYASFGHNKALENTAGEEARGRVSNDGGRTWGPVFTIDAGQKEQGLAVSHGVFFVNQGRLWAFLGAFYHGRERVHARAYLLNDATQAWEPRGLVVDGGFWPMQEPLRLANGNWIMAGFKVGDGEPASVAISHGDDLLRWDHVVIPRAASVRKMWGESTILVDGNRVLNIARYGDEAQALVSVSEDGGHQWTPMASSNLPMVTSKPYAGRLRNGQRYLVATTTADSGKRRAPLTIAVSRPGATHFSKVFLIRGAESASGGESNPRGNLSYPYATEHGDSLYVGYSNNAGRKGMNLNSAEMAVIPLRSLRA